jgi:hypothetical protein
MKKLDYSEIRATAEHKEGISNLLREITKGADHLAVGKAWLLWITCTMRDKSDNALGTLIRQGYGQKMSGFINWLISAMKEPEAAREVIYSVTIGTGATFAHVIFNDGQTLTWQVSDAPEEKECYEFNGLEIQGFAQGHLDNVDK